MDSYSSKPIWINFAIAFFGIWLIATAFTFSMNSNTIFWNDIICGFLLIILSYLSFNNRHAWIFWTITALGIWLQLAPLLFWAPQAISYLNDTLIGIFVIIFSTLLPSILTNQSSSIPRTWSFNPSSWQQRLPTIILCMTCWFIARYMASYQLGYLDFIWDPIFGVNGTVKVITSKLSQSFPISDAGLGAFVYTLEALLGCTGGQNRWHSMPWMVIIFGIMVLPAGLVTILLIISQPILVGHWCFWCLLIAFLMLLMIAFTADEVIAVVHYLKQIKREKEQDFWKIFWKGEAISSMKEIHTSNKVLGISFPWNLVLSIIIGIWVMFTPQLFHLTKNVQSIVSILGALTVTVAIISCSEALRSVRLFNILIGFLMLMIIFSFQEYGKGFMNGLVCGIALILLSTVNQKFYT